MMTIFFPCAIESDRLQRHLDAVNVGIVAHPLPVFIGNGIHRADCVAAESVRRDMKGSIAILCGIVTEKPLRPTALAFSMKSCTSGAGSFT